jgi:hypothetical protein
VKTSGDSSANDLAEFTIKFDLTAFDDTFYVDATAGTSTEAGAVAAIYKIENSAGTEIVYATSTVSDVLSSTASLESGDFRIDEDDTETFTLKVTFNPSDTPGSGDYRVQLVSVDFGDDAGASVFNQTAHIASPDEDFETEYVFLNK